MNYEHKEKLPIWAYVLGATVIGFMVYRGGIKALGTGGVEYHKANPEKPNTITTSEGKVHNTATFTREGIHYLIVYDYPHGIAITRMH